MLSADWKHDIAMCTITLGTVGTYVHQGLPWKVASSGYLASSTSVERDVKKELAWYSAHFNVATCYFSFLQWEVPVLLS